MKTHYKKWLYATFSYLLGPWYCHLKLPPEPHSPSVLPHQSWSSEGAVKEKRINRISIRKPESIMVSKGMGLGSWCLPVPPESNPLPSPPPIQLFPHSSLATSLLTLMMGCFFTNLYMNSPEIVLVALLYHNVISQTVISQWHVCRWNVFCKGPILSNWPAPVQP